MKYGCRAHDYGCFTAQELARTLADQGYNAAQLAKFIPPVKDMDTKRNKGSGLIAAFLNRCHGSVRFRRW